MISGLTGLKNLGSFNVQYDEIIERKFKENIIINYGIIKGEIASQEKTMIVFIKVGQDGSIYGYQDKYLQIAKRLNALYNYSVIVASNPSHRTNPLDCDMEVVSWYCKKSNIFDYQIYYMGQSNGALIGLSFAYMYHKIKRLLLINSPLMFNFHLIKNGLKNMQDKKVYIVYGSLDPSIKYTELLGPLLSDTIKLQVIEGADHNFAGKLNTFMELPISYFK